MRYLLFLREGHLSTDALRRGLERVEALLLAESTLRGALARRDAGCDLPGDASVLRARSDEILATQEPDGSWRGPGGELAATAAALLEVAELEDLLREGREGEAPAAVTGAVTWLRGRRGAAGRFADGCGGPAWHAAGLCHHFLAGFHAPLQAGADPDRRVTDAALALRAALRWGDRGTTLDLHLDGLRQVVGHWAWPPGAPLLAARSGVASLAAVLEAPQTPANIACAADGVACLVRTQRADGTWHGVELFEALETLLLGIAHGFRVDEVDRALSRCAQLLALTQKENGMWGSAAMGRQALTAWRTFRHALGHPGAAQPIPV